MKRRRVLASIDDIVRLLADYCGADNIPQNVQALKLMIRPTEQGRIGIMCESPDWAAGLPPLDVKFELRRLHSL